MYHNQKYTVMKLRRLQGILNPKSVGREVILAATVLVRCSTEKRRIKGVNSWAHFHRDQMRGTALPHFPGSALNNH